MSSVAPVLDEAEILRGAATGQPNDVRRLLDATGPVLYGFVLARVGGQRSVAEDIVQETYLEAIRSAHTFRGESAVATWLCAIARHRLARHYNKERKQEELRANLAAVVPLEADDLEAVERDDAVMHALGRLPVTQRQALVYKYLDGLSVEEIAVRMERPAVQVQSLLQRGRDRLRHLLESADG